MRREAALKPAFSPKQPIATEMASIMKTDSSPGAGYWRAVLTPERQSTGQD